MKAQSKAIVASLVVLALAVCAVSGATYSWFSDTEEAEINITAGEINLDITEGSVLYYNHVGDEIPPADIESNGVVFTGGNDSQGNDSQFTVTVSGMAPGDVLKLQFSGTLTNTIKAVLLFNTDVSAPAGLSSPFTIVNEYTVNEVPYGNYVSAANDSKTLVSTVTITMANVGNEYNGAKFAIGLNFSAYQANTPGSDLPQDSMINTVSGTIYANEDTTISVSTPTDSRIGGVSLMFPSGSVETDTTIQVSAVSGATNEDTSFVAAMEEYGSIIGGVNVSGVESLSSVSTIGFTIAGDYSGTKLAIYHEGKGLTYVNNTPSQNGEFTTSYNSEDNITTVTICASEFSTYYAVSVDAVASINGVEYYSLKEAFAVGGDIILLRDVDLIDEKFTILQDGEVSLSLSNYTITAVSTKTGANQDLFVVKGVLAISGPGVITYEHTGDNMEWNNMSAIFDITAGGFLTLDEGVVAKNLGGTDMNFVAHLNNWGEAKLSADEATLEAGYVAIRVFNSGPNLNTVTITDSSIKAGRSFWVHNYTIVDFGTVQKAYDQKGLLNISINESNEIVGDFRFGFTDSSYLTFDEWLSTGLPEIFVDVSDADELVEALENGYDVCFENNIEIDPANMSNAYGTTGINVKKGQTIDGNGHILDIKGAGGTWDSGINTTGGLIKNLTVTGSFRGIFINHNSTHSEPVVLENVTIDGTTYTISCDQGLNQNFKAYDCTFNGWTSYAATLGNAKFVNCSFGEGNGYAYCRPYAPTEFVGCSFEAGFEMDSRATVTFENCTLDGVAITSDNVATLVTSNIANASVKQIES